ncbi:MAG TPA: alkaline phosphatase family protein, partial [Polyangia bacterium]
SMADMAFRFALWRPAKSDARMRFLAASVGVLVMGLAGVQADTYKYRLANRWGSHLIAADRGPAVPPAPSAQRARRVILVVVDGMRADAALQMQATDWLKSRGTCRRTDVGTLTRSRSVYALLSSGVEADRSGVRTNDVHTPAPMDSIWQVARSAGRHVSGVSAEPWWQELFPDGFDEYRVEPNETDQFAKQPAPDGLVLIHPGYVDDAGHGFGAASPRYHEAVGRVDHELLRFLAALDLDRDVVLLTADHGHTDRGGHGSDTPELRTVLTCAAGRGVAHGPTTLDPVIDARALPALLAVLAGLPLPRHLDIESGDLDALLGILDPAAFPANHAALYRRELETRHAARDLQLSSWLGEANATWAMLANHERRIQLMRFATSVAAGLLVLLVLAKRRHGSFRSAAATLGWIALAFAGSYGATQLTRGSFDLAAVNTGRSFIIAQSLTSAVVLLALGLLHLRLWRDLDRLLFDGIILTAAQAGLAVAHLVGFGWPLGFPLPAPGLLFLPYPLAAFMAVTGAALVGMAIIASRGHPPGRSTPLT